MPTVTLHPGDVYAQNVAAAQDWRGVYVDSTRWSDGSDSTYVALDPTAFVSAYGVLEPLVGGGTVTAMTLHVRAQATGSGGSIGIDPALWHDDGIPGNPPVLDIAFSGGSVPKDSATHDLSFPSSFGDMSDALAQLAAGTSLIRFQCSTSPGFFIFETWLELTVRAKCPPLRRWPHLDAYGRGPRRYPNPPRLRPGTGGGT